MRKVSILIIIVAMMVLLVTAQSAQADILRGSSVFTDMSVIINHNGSNSSVYLSPMRVTNMTTNQPQFITFCGDPSVSTSSSFNGATGQEFGYFNLFSSSLTLYTAQQKTRINDLFRYAYATAYDLNGNVINVENARALQLVLWEVLGETSGTYNIQGGTFRVTTALSTSLLNTVNNWFGALQGTITWASLGLTAYNDYDMTVYVPAGGTLAGQTMISITAPTSSVPEPSSLLFFGLGTLAVAPFFRKRKK